MHVALCKVCGTVVAHGDNAVTLQAYIHTECIGSVPDGGLPFHMRATAIREVANEEGFLAKFSEMAAKNKARQPITQQDKDGLETHLKP